MTGLPRVLASFILVVSCSGPPPELRYHGDLSGRVLMAPGVGLSRATVAIESIEIYGHGQVPRGEVRGHVVDVMTDENGFYAASTGAFAGIIRVRTMGGEYRDPISGARIRLDESQGLRALYFMDFFHARANANVTPVHTFAEARFRYLVGEGQDPLSEALPTSYADVGAHFGQLDWEHTLPAEPSAPAVSPTEPVRAMAVLGGLAMLADDLRLASGSTPQVVNLMTLVQAIVRDLEADPILDGNDGNDGALGSGVQVGICDAVPGCSTPPAGCQLGACRPRCDTYANTYRGALTAAIRKYLGPKASPTDWNHTGLGSEDIRTMLAQIAEGGPQLFGDACRETADRVEPSIAWELAPNDGAAVKGTFTVRVRAIDDAEGLPSISFLDHVDEDSATNTATLTLDSRAALGGLDGPLVLHVLARDPAGNERRASRTFLVDNTAPIATLDASAFYVHPDTLVHWTADATPTITGTISDAHAKSVEVLIAGAAVATATIEGMTWSAELASGYVTSSGVDLSVRATDEAGNVTTTAPVLMRLDTTPPAILVEPSLVHDEAQSREFYDLDNPSANVWLQRHVVQGDPIDLSQSMEGGCSTVRKYAHLLHEQLPLGVAGALNPLQVSSVVSDDGVGIRPGSVQARLTIKTGAATVEALPWTAVSGTLIGPQTTRYPVGLYRDGALAIPSLATTEGEALLELRAVDHFGRVTRQARCWNHRVLAPKLRAPPGQESGVRAEGFSRALYSTSLNPTVGQVGDFSAKFLNTNAAGAAVWAWRVKNYVAHPVYVTVTIAQPVNAQVYRKFAVRQTLTDLQPTLYSCGSDRCPIAAGSELFASPETPVPELQQGVRFRVRAFVVSNASTGETGAELLPCTGCTNDDTAQSYTFQIPARATPQGAALVEYAILTYLRPTISTSNGTDVLMAPSMSGTANPHALDTTPGPYSEFTLNGVTLTGKLIPPAGLPVYGCVDQSNEGPEIGWVCNVQGRYQRYRALTYARYALTLEVKTSYEASASIGIVPRMITVGVLPSVQQNDLTSYEAPLP